MGRLLDIAQAVPLVEIAPAKQAVKQKVQLDHIVYRTEGEQGRAISEISAVSQVSPPTVEWSRSASDALDALVKADAPMLHSALVAALAGRGYDKGAAYHAIADAQGRGWIEHNLTTGYVLGGLPLNETEGSES